MSRFLVLFFFFLSLTSAKAQETPLFNTLLDEKDKIATLFEKAKTRIQYYKPIYFAYSDPLTKIQFSFSSQLVEDFPLYFAYSQVIFWELGADSKPFLDATYNPEFFYRYRWSSSQWSSLDLGVWEHNSNGKAAAESRSYDQTYLRLNFAFEGARWITGFSAKFKYLYNNDKENQDIYDYVGPFEFDIRFIQLFDSWFDQAELILSLRPGGKWSTEWEKGGYELGLNFHLGGLKVIPAFYIQYFHGYAETLINYSQKVDEVRFGLMF